MPSTPMFEAVGLTKRYEDGVLALDHVSFTVFPGQVYAMLGGNGAGKTTTINLFLNFIEPTEGEARIDGIVTHKEPLRAKSKIAFVSENVMLYPNFTALQNLEYFTRLGGRRDVTRDECREVLLRVGLDEEAHHKRLKGFSKGMRQKCGIAIAILKNAPAILLDEPTSGLDLPAQGQFMDLLTRLKLELSLSVIFVSHDVQVLARYADEMVCINRTMHLHGKPADVLDSDRLAEAYKCEFDFLYRTGPGAPGAGAPAGARGGSGSGGS